MASSSMPSRSSSSLALHAPRKIATGNAATAKRDNRKEGMQLRRARQMPTAAHEEPAGNRLAGTHTDQRCRVHANPTSLSDAVTARTARPHEGHVLERGIGVADPARSRTQILVRKTDISA